MKTVFFTGATGGLGQACVAYLASRGYRVFAAGTNAERLDALGKIPNVTPTRMDVTDQASVDAARAFVESYTGALWAVVNFAGVTAFCSMVEGGSVETAQRVVDINLMGTVRVNRAFFELVRRGGGRIVNCSSDAGWMKSQPFAAPYFMTKHAVESYSDSLRRELMFLGVPVVVLAPGAYKTAMLREISAQFDRTLQQTKLYESVLTKLKRLMTRELEGGGDPQALAKALFRALEAKHPRLRYRVGTSRTLLPLEFLPDALVDRLYLMMLKH